jgi:hypothetical protein
MFFLRRKSTFYDVRLNDFKVTNITNYVNIILLEFLNNLGGLGT